MRRAEQNSSILFSVFVGQMSCHDSLNSKYYTVKALWLRHVFLNSHALWFTFKNVYFACRCAD